MKIRGFRLACRHVLEVALRIIVIWFAVAGSASAQTPATLIVVTVTDQLGDVLPGATVQISGEDGREYSASSDGTGRYTAAVPSGTYALHVALDGFAPYRQRVTVATGRTVRVAARLTVQVVETIRVERLAIGGRDSLTGLTLSGAELALLPSNPVELLNRLMELAGTRGRPGDVALYVDGFRDFRRLPPKDAIELIQINAEPFSAEFPEPGTRRIEIVTKPGTDRVYGDVQFDFNDESLNATDAFATGKPPLQRRGLSGYIGGPIIPGKWGYYAYAGGWEQDENAVVNARVLDASLNRALFSTTLAAPSRVGNATLSTNVAMGGGLRMKAEYSRDETRVRNQGLQSGIDLPERAWDGDVTVDTGRLHLLWIAGQAAVFEARVQGADERQRGNAISQGPAIIVFDAFNGGGNQPLLFNRRVTQKYLWDSKLTLALGSSTLKIGTSVDRIDVDHENRADFGGTFTFAADTDRDGFGQPVIIDGAPLLITPLEAYRRTMLQLPGYAPALFTQTTGNPSAAVRQWNYAAYAQNDWRPTDRVTLSLGIRHDGQTNIRRRPTVAPRVGMAWSPGSGKMIVRAGAGVFHQRVEPELTLDAARFTAQGQQRLVVAHPLFFPKVPLRAELGAGVVNTIWTMAPDIRLPEVLIGTAGVERDLPLALQGSATYTYERGERLLRQRDVTVAGQDVARILQFESTGRSERHELQIGLRLKVGQGGRVFSNYTLGWTRSDTDGPYTIPANSKDLAAEMGPSQLDERHRGFVSGSFTLPWVGLLVVPSLAVTSPRSFNITSGLDLNGDTYFTDRPALVDKTDPDAIDTAFGLFDPTPDPGESVIGRNFGRQAPQVLAALALSKIFAFTTGSGTVRAVALTVSSENLFNRTNLANYNGVLLSPVFGRANRAQAPRRVLISLQASF